jgi:hypothetical protein
MPRKARIDARPLRLARMAGVVAGGLLDAASYHHPHHGQLFQNRYKSPFRKTNRLELTEGRKES